MGRLIPAGPRLVFHSKPAPCWRRNLPAQAIHRLSDPTPFSAYQIIADRLRSATWPVMPHCRTTSRIVFVEPKSSGPQTGPAFTRQGIGKNRVMPERPSCPPRRAVKHRTRIACTISAKARYLCRSPVVESRRDRPANNRHPA
jgi:hypothetical protein